MSESTSRRRVTFAQLEVLWEFLNSHRDIAMGFNKSVQARENMKRFWIQITENLNAIGDGAFKDWKGWSAYWIDYKGKLKRKCAALRTSQSRTGGGPSEVQNLTEIEKKYLIILGEDFGTGLPGVQVDPFPQLDINASTEVIEGSAFIIQSEHVETEGGEERSIEDVQHATIADTEPQTVAGALPQTVAGTQPQTVAGTQPETVAGAGPTRRRHQRHTPPLTQEAARQALLASSQQRVQNETQNSQTIMGILQVLTCIAETLERMERRSKHTEMFIDENETPESWWVSALLKTIRAVALMFDVITFPIHIIYQRPWRKRALSRRIKARIINTTPNSLTVRSVSEPCALHLRLVRDGVTSMEAMLRAAAARWGPRACLGTRAVRGEEDEPQPNGRLFKKFNMGDYMWRSYTAVEREAAQFGAGLRELGCAPRRNVVMFAETRAEWMIAAHGCFKQSIPVVTIYATLGDEAIAHGINETEVSTVVTSHDLLPKFKKILAKTPKVDTIIYMEDQLKATERTGFKPGTRIVGYKDVVQMGISSKIDSVPPTPMDTAIIMYTSGSTGVPKGVVLSHRNMLATLKAFADAMPIYDGDVLMGFLPLAHVFELLAESLCLFGGVPIGYSTPLTMLDSSSKIMKGTKGDATILQPTCITTVPLIMDRISKGITERVARSGAFASAFFKWAYQYKQTWMRRGYDTPVLNRIMFSRVRMLLGGRVRMMIVGGAPLAPDTHTQVRICACCDVVAGYGLTETTSCATVMDVRDRSTGRVGAPTAGTDVRLLNWEEGNYRVTNKPFPQGEIVIGGECVAEGYYKNPEKTREEFIEEDGRRWFRSGDIGELHHDGCIKIIDRKKDLVKLQAGEYVSLGKVEAELKTCPIVENICVYGDSSKTFTVALVVPNPLHLAELAQRVGVSDADFDTLCTNANVEKAVVKELAEHARKCGLEKFEVPAAVKLCTEVWSPDMGLVTAAFKIKRKDIQERYKEDIKRMYAS